jgi:probable phosphoglycerate mutase
MRALEQAYLLGVDGVTEVWLVRHADVYEDLAEVEDPPLSARGREQAGRLAHRLRSVRVDAVYASPSRRALETARTLGQAVRVDARLGEAMATYAGGRLRVEEPAADTARRMRDAVDEAVDTSPGGRIVMIGHGIAILTYLADALRLEPGSLRMYPPFAGVSIVRLKTGKRAVGTIFDVSHLEAMA